ncbi:Nucleoporin [Kalmanozyma brasiliensis GHG001]|uniref:Nucleoporin n=1 Tax=Kalmanozyma brasiliensis (strain GHG001) TaxID=1365824 RepID=V5E604_KALBG|nr:Nucleoporin [Kalmanozyma brasiliensis GHG001]EST05651.1 Nucleoporin [Kalmanozyma brasiliensis GHG001]
MPAAPSASTSGSAGGIAVFEPTRFERLHRIINEAASNPIRLSRSNDWFVTIDRNRSDLADLGKVRPPSEAERKEIESGKITINGNTQNLNPDFAQQSLLLSRELAVSEHYAASLLQQGLAGRAKWGRPAVEVACILYHRERLALLACLKELLRNALTMPFDDDVEAQRMGIKMEQLVESLVSIETSVGSGSTSTRKVTLAERILVEIDNAKQSAARVKASLESPSNNTANQGIQTQTSNFFGLSASQAASQSASVSNPTSGRLSDEIQLDRLGWLREERRELGHLLYLLSISSLLTPSNISAILRWLAAVSAETYDEMTIYILTALLGAIDATPEARAAMADRASRGTLRKTVEALLDDESFITSTHAEITRKKWALGELNSAVALQWSIFLVEAFSRNPSYRNQLSISEEQIQDLVLLSITGSSLSKDSTPAGNADDPTGGASIFLVVRVLAFRQRTIDALFGEEEDAVAAEADAAAGEVADTNAWDDEVDTEFREYVVQQLHNLAVGTTSVMLPMLRRIQRSEEDAAFALSRGVGARGGSVPQRRYDIEALFDLIALLCRGRPEAGLPFWVGPDNRTTRFLAWAIDVREPGHQRALLNMLASMSSGPQSASQAYALLDQESTQSGAAGEGRLVSWTRFFEWISYYIDTFHQAVNSSSFHASSYQSLAMPKNEETLLIGFVRLFRNVVYFSHPARDALLQNSSYNALDKLFSLLTCPVPVELKASILDALAAFLHQSTNNPDAQARFSAIATQLWDRFDECGLLPSDASAAAKSRLNGNVNGATSGSFGPAFKPLASKGVIYELENFEVPLRAFPGSTSFVNFLKALVQLPPVAPAAGSAALSDTTAASSTGANPFGSIVSYGQQAQQQQIQGQMQPAYQSQQRRQFRSVEPYVDFVIDQVFLKARARDYAEPAEQWRVVASCLEFVERSLRSYDLAALLRNSEGADAVSDPTLLTQLASHPGFFLMRRILTGSKMVGEMLGILVPGSGLAAFEAINQNRASTFFYGSSVRHVLSILDRVLRYQDLYAQVLIPTLVDSSLNGTQLPFDVSARVGNAGSYSSFDVQLLHAHESVVQIALLVNCVRDDVALLSIRLLSLIARTAAFSAVDRFGEMGYRRKMNRLVGLLEMSDEAGRVKAGYVSRLEAEPSGDAGSAKAIEALNALAGGADLEDAEDADLQAPNGSLDAITALASGDAVEAIQIAIINLLLAGTELNQPAPNVAHLLLGYDLRAIRPEEQVIVDPDAQTAAPSAIHAILALLRPESDSDGTTFLSLAERSPGFADKCCSLILRLCTHPFTSAATLRYLRTKEDFVVQQLRSLPLVPAERGTLTSSSAALGVVQFADGQGIETTVDRVTASLRMRASLLELTALELHSLLNAGMQTRAARVVAALFGPNATAGGGNGVDADDSIDEDDLLLGTERDFRLGAGGAEVRTFGGVRFLEILQSLDFEWYDDREALGQSITVITPEQLDFAKRPDAAAGPRMFDLGAVLAVLVREKTLLQQKGNLRDAGQADPFLEQAAFVLQWASAQNAKKAVAFSRRRVLQAWRHTLDMVLARAAGLLRTEVRSSLMFDCLAELLPRISAPSADAGGLDVPSADLVAGAVLSLLTSLRQHRVELTTGALDIEAVDALPVDRLLTTLRALIDSVLRLDTTTVARGNLYSALINFLQLVQTGSGADTSGEAGANDGASVIATDLDDAMSVGGISTTTTNIFGGRAQTSGLEARTRALLLSHAERLMDVLGRDALDASDLSKTIAFTLLDKLCALDAPASVSASSRRAGSKCLDVLDRKGYIKSFVTALRDSDVVLQVTLRPDPASLNALYVYEARLAFFNRMAQTRDGAERLLNAKIFDVLAQSDYLAARPDQDQEFVDLDSFLPAATERYNALLTPVLQLTTSILASASAGSALGGASSQGISKALAPTSAAAAPRHALALLTAHRDALLTVLRAPLQEFCSSAQLSQAHLVVAIFVLIMPSLDDDAQQAPSPLAPFHSAIIAFAAVYLTASSWRSRIVPYTEVEREESREPTASLRALRASSEAPNGGGNGAAEEESAFSAKVNAMVVRLQMTLLSYLEAASDARGSKTSRVRPVLIPSLATNRERSHTPYGAGDDDGDSSRVGYLRSQRASAAASTVPSIGGLVAALDDYTDSVAKELQGLENIETLLENVDSVRQDELDEIARDALGEVTAGELSPAQRRSVALRQLCARKATLRASSTTKLDAVELILVLLIRHIEFFRTLNNDRSTLPALGGARSSPAPLFAGAGAGSHFDRTTLMQGLAESLLPIVDDKIGYLSLPPSLVANARERQSFLQMAGRRLASFFTEAEQ